MKKIFYSLALLVMGFASCTTWDDPVTEKYDAGPAVDINVMAVEPSDSAFKVTITPAAGTTYYAFLIEKGSEAKARDGYTLLKGGYSNTVVSASEKNPTDSLFKGEPNTTYQVYAVACNDKGIVGDVVVKNITTTDQNAPTYLKMKDDPDTKSATAEFNQALKRGEGLVKGIYYKEWDWDNPVALASEDIEVTIDGKNVKFAAPKAPAGAFIGFSWEKGAFVDAAGNQCAAFTSYYDEKTDKFVGVWVHAANEAFPIKDEYVTPVSGSLIGDWQDATIKVTFPFNIYYVKEDVEQGDIQVIFVNDNRELVHNLTAGQWSVDGKTIVITLPAEPTVNDKVSVFINEGVVFDVYGNSNEEYVSENIDLTYAGFIPTKDMVIGDFVYFATVKGTEYNLGAFSISEDGEDFIVSDFYLEGSEMKATADFSAGKLYFPHLAPLGQEEDEVNGTPTVFNIYTYDATGGERPSFDINKDGTLTSTNLILVGNPVGTTSLYYWVNATSSKLQRPAAAKAKKAKNGKLMGKKGAKLKATLKK